MKASKIFVIWACIIVVTISIGIGYSISEKSETNIKSNELQTSPDAMQQLVDQAETLPPYSTYEESTSNRPISEITESEKGKIVKIQGTVKNIKHHDNGHVFFDISDSTGEIYVEVFKDKNINSDMITENKSYQISGKVDIFNGKLEVIPETEKDIVEIIDFNNSYAITKENVGKETSIECTVLSKYTNADGHVFLSVKINEKEITIPIFKSIQYDSSQLTKNTVIQITGEISEYRGKLQVIPNAKEDIVIKELGEGAVAKLMLLDEITESNRGELVDVRGIPYDISESNGHYYFKLKSDNKSIKAVMFKAESDEIKERILKIKDYQKAGKTVRVNGIVDIYNEELEVIIKKVYIND